MVQRSANFSSAGDDSLGSVASDEPITATTPGIRDLVRFARGQFELSEAVDDKGTTLRKSLQAVAALSERAREALAAAPPCPPGLEYLWEWYAEIRDRVAPSMGVALIPFDDFAAWERFTGNALESYEFIALDAIDREYLAHSRGNGDRVIVDGQQSASRHQRD